MYIYIYIYIYIDTYIYERETSVFMCCDNDAKNKEQSLFDEFLYF